MRAEEAIVLVGGLGTRLRSEVSNVPKPLAPVAGRPFIAWVLDELEARGMRRAILATGYMSDFVERALGTRWGRMQLAFSFEDEPLGTGGAIRQACDMLEGEGVHVLNGDTFLRYEPAALESMVLEAEARIGIALACVPDVARYGAVDCSEGKVRCFREKGLQGQGLINAGCYYLAPEAIAGLPGLGCYSFETQVLVEAAKNGEVVGYAETHGFIDIGVPEDYRRAQTMFAGLA